MSASCGRHLHHKLSVCINYRGFLHDFEQCLQGQASLLSEKENDELTGKEKGKGPKYL